MGVCLDGQYTSLNEPCPLLTMHIGSNNTAKEVGRYICVCVCANFPQWSSSGLPLLFKQRLTLLAFCARETERHSWAEDLPSGTERATCMLPNTHELKCISCFPESVCVCVFVCSAPIGRGSPAVPYLDSGWRGGGVEVTWVYSRILAIGPKTEKNDQKSFLKGKHTRAASVNKTTND